MHFNEHRLFLRELEREAIQMGKELVNQFYEKQNQKLKENKKPKDGKVIEIKREENEIGNSTILYRYTYDVNEKKEGQQRSKTVEKNKDQFVTIYETELTEGRYHQLIVNYYYILHELPGNVTCPEIINKVSGMKNKDYTYKGFYFALKYYYDFLGNEPTEEKDFAICKQYYYQGLAHYIVGLEWDNFFDFMCTEIFGVEQVSVKDRLAKEGLWLIDKYGYTCKELIIALKYFYQILERPVPDEPHLKIIPSIMKNAKEQIGDEEERQILINYIYDLFGLNKQEIYPLIQAEIRRYHSREYGKLTYKGMISTLDYYYNIMGNPLPHVPNVGIIPYQYNNALNFYQQRKAVKDNGDLPDTVPVVRISISREARLKSQQLYEDRYKWKPTKLISEIEVDEDETFDRL